MLHLSLCFKIIFVTNRIYAHQAIELVSRLWQSLIL